MFTNDVNLSLERLKNNSLLNNNNNNLQINNFAREIFKSVDDFVVHPQITWTQLNKKQVSETIIKTDGLGDKTEDKKNEES